MRGDRSVEFAVYALADRLHKTVSEIVAMTLEEFSGWQAYFKVREEQREKR